MNRSKISLVALALAGTTPLTAQAATITGWNNSKVDVGSPVTGTQADASVVYDRDFPDASAVTNGQIYYAAPEADTPGLRVSNDAYTTGQGTFDG